MQIKHALPFRHQAMDDLLASDREKTIQNHRLESQVGEMKIRISHCEEDLAKAVAERDRYKAESQDASGQLSAVSEELKEYKAKYEALKVSLVPTAVDHKRKRDDDEADFKLLAPAFREQHTNASSQSKHWSSTNTASQLSSPRYESAPTTPQRPSMLSYLSTSTDSSSSSTETSPRLSPIPGLQADLRATGVHSTPWSQVANPYSLQSSPMSTRSNTPTQQDSQRTTDPRKRAKHDTNETPTRNTSSRNSTPSTTTTTQITQISSTVTNSPPKRHRGTPSPSKPLPEGPRIPSEYRKRTISLRAVPLRSSPRRTTSAYRKEALSFRDTLSDGEVDESS
ncbi:hypothetical protein DFH09DRAFT_269978 [Mycena vulgaris]|nr:hypothetical protein DFH09DRAFT_269978 [Mycena vulgaris]